MNQAAPRWRGGVGAAICLGTVGLAAQSGALVLAAIVPLAYVGFAVLTSRQRPVEVRVTRHVDPDLVPPGSPVGVTLTVVNESERTLPDVRVVDGVPTDLAVTRGSPRDGATLEPGEAITIEYVLVARRGVHAFDPPEVRSRTLGGASVTTLEPTVEGESELVCRLDADAPPIEDRGARFVGHLATGTPGDGLAFHSTREYRRGDDVARIDWRTYAKRGDLATVNYEQRRGATVVLVVDARRISRVCPGPGHPSAVERSAYAATHAGTDLLRAGHEVGVAVIGTDGPGPAGLHWLPPASGPEQREHALSAFRAAVEATGSAPDVGRQVTELLALVPSGAQLALFSPLLDDRPVDMLSTWRSQGHPAVVLSPDVLSSNTVGGQFEQVQRRTRLARCQVGGGRVTDWRRGTPLQLVLAHTFATATRSHATAHAGGRGR